MKNKKKLLVKIALSAIILVVAGLAIGYNLTYKKFAPAGNYSSEAYTPATTERGFPFAYEVVTAYDCPACLQAAPTIVVDPINQWARLGDIFIVAIPASLLAWFIVRRF